MLTLLETKSATAAPAKDETKRLCARTEVKAVDTEERTYEALLSTWDLDLGGDVVHRGAFKRTLNHWRSSGRVMPLLDSHNSDTVRSAVGKLLDAKETKDGLWTKWEVIDGPDGDEILRRLKGGYVDGMSIGYRPVKIEEPTEAEERSGIWRHLKEVELREGSLVVFPMNPGARVDADSVKSLLATYKDGDLTDDQRAELKALHDEIGALLNPAPAKADPAEGLAPEDTRRIALEERARALKLQRLATRATA